MRRLIFTALVAVAAACSASGGGGSRPGSNGGSSNGGTNAGGTNAGGSIGITGGSSGSIGIGGSGNVSGSGVGGSGFAGDCGISKQAENQIRPVDIVWAIDNSCSMTFEAGEVQNNMNTFANAILSQGIDVHVAIISEAGPPAVFVSNGVCIPPPLGSGSCPNDSNPPIYLRVDDSVGSNNPLNKLIEHYPNYKPILRQNALKYFAVVTDDNSNMSSQDFINAVGALDPGWFDVWRFFGVYCTGSCPVLLACAATGTVYAELTQSSGTAPGDMCQGQSNFSGVFSQLAQVILSGAKLDCRWDIPPPPEGEVFNPAKVNVRYTPGGTGAPQDIFYAQSLADCGTADGWYFEPDELNPQRVAVCPNTCNVITNDLSGRVDVSFGCDRIDVPH